MRFSSYQQLAVHRCILVPRCLLRWWHRPAHDLLHRMSQVSASLTVAFCKEVFLVSRLRRWGPLSIAVEEPTICSFKHKFSFCFTLIEMNEVMLGSKNYAAVRCTLQNIQALQYEGFTRITFRKIFPPVIERRNTHRNRYHLSSVHTS